MGDLGDYRAGRPTGEPEGIHGGASGGIPSGAPSAGAAISSTRRWVADPLPQLGLVGLTAVVLGVLHLMLTPIPWPVPALLGVVAAGLALSGST